MTTARAVITAVAAALLAGGASAQEFFLLDNLGYTVSTPRGPVAFSETQFPVGTVINGKTVTKLNNTSLPAPLAFTFTVYDTPSSDAAVTDQYTGCLTYLDGNMVKGTTAGVLGIDFGTDVTSVSFGFALATIFDTPMACTITAFDSTGKQVGSATADASQVFCLSEGEAGLTQATAFRRVKVKFASSFPDRIPALDPLGLALLGLLIAALGALLARH
jgi:hypothetical protein